MPDWVNIIPTVLSIVGGVASTIAILTWWLSGQFSHQRNLFFTKMDQVVEKITTKLEYHERHDDKRFADIRDDIWEIRLRNAAKDGNVPSVRKYLDQEKYSEEDNENHRKRRSQVPA